MQPIDKTIKLNVDKLKSLLLQRRATRETFKLPMTQDQAADFLLAGVMGEVEYRHGVFEDTPVLRGYINKVSQWLTSSDHKFGLVLCGTCGNGKTTLMRAICSVINFLNIKDQYNDSYSIGILSAKDIAHKNKDDYTAYKQICGRTMLAIDDLGFESAEVLSYGNVLNPLIDLIEQRYTDQLFTLITTNLTPEQIRERYGDRIADRFNEMMTKIIFTNSSYRTR